MKVNCRHHLNASTIFEIDNVYIVEFGAYSAMDLQNVVNDCYEANVTDGYITKITEDELVSTDSGKDYLLNCHRYLKYQ
jgi:hypothetical protein